MVSLSILCTEYGTVKKEIVLGWVSKGSAVLHPCKWLNEVWASTSSHLSPWLCKPVLSYGDCFFLLLMKMTISSLYFYEWENKRLSIIYALQCPMPTTGRTEN